MAGGLIFSIGSIFFEILLISSYRAKNKNVKNNISVSLYRKLLLLSLLIAITEIIEVVLICNFDSKIVSYIAVKVAWFVGIMFFFYLYYYCECFVFNYNYPSLRELIRINKRSKIYYYISMICIIIFFALPVTHASVGDFSYLPGPGSYFCIAYFGISMAFVVNDLIKSGVNSDNSRRVIFILIIILTVICSFQFFFQDIVFYAIGSSWGMLVLYFNIENPDLKYIEEIDLLKLSIERSSRTKSEFLSNMSHEIRSPMNAIVGFSSTILTDTEFDKDRIIADISHIKSSSKNLLNIINDILDISKVETGSDTIEEKIYSLKDSIIDLTRIVETRIGEKNIKFITEVDKDIPIQLVGDSTKIFEIILNILTNSVKYTEVGRIKLSITKEMSEIAVKLHFKVSDTGFGIKKEDYDKVFQKYSRLDSTKTNEIEGTGLGLVLTKKYAQLMGGDIWFESEYGAGTTFYFDVVQKIYDPAPMGEIVEDAITETVKTDFIDCSGYKVLIVDDDQLNLQVTERLLSVYNFTIDKLSSAKDCIFKFKNGEEYDLIFLDHIMPEVNGVDAVHVIKGLSGYKIPPVVALTANAISGVRDYYLKEGFDEYLSKPIDVIELDNIINKYFKK